MTRAVALASGGLDSSTVMAIAKREGFDVYALSFDYALTKDFPLADKEFERAIGLKQPDEFGLFFVNRIQYIQKLAAVDQKTNAWFDKQKRRLLSR